MDCKPGIGQRRGHRDEAGDKSLEVFGKSVDRKEEEENGAPVI